MHIPDGFLDVKTAASAGALSTAALSMAVRQTRLHLPQKKVPLMGLAGAFIFAAQMLNFPVPGGTSGHLVGGVLASVLLGPVPPSSSSRRCSSFSAWSLPTAASSRWAPTSSTWPLLVPWGDITSSEESTG